MSDLQHQIDSFNRRVSQWAKDKPAEVITKFQRALTIEALSRVVLMTPVDTGRARGGWQISVSTIDVSSPNRLDQSGQKVIEDESKKVGDLKPFKVVFLQNNVAYIGFLERGSSQQAPKGMLGVTVRALTQIKFS